MQHVRFALLAVLVIATITAAAQRGSSGRTAASTITKGVGEWNAVPPARLQAELTPFFSSSAHTNNWAVLVCTSRFWFNYRHVANTLSIYRTVKRLGIPDNQIILMLADDMACNARNPYPGLVFNNHHKTLNLYGEHVEVDYRGYQVTVDSFLRVLTGRHEEQVPRSKRLLTDDRSNILVYMTGHGGDEFLKFQDYEEVTSMAIADAFEQMHQQRRYNEILFITDTCQANTMYKTFYSPNIIGMGSSDLGENSYAHHSDEELGLSVIDRFTYYLLEFMEQIFSDSSRSVMQLFNSLNPEQLRSHPGIETFGLARSINEARLTDFFGAVLKTEPTDAAYPLGK